MKLDLARHSYSPTETMGVLSVGRYELATIERPWIPDDRPGGLGFESCIPDGTYKLRPHTRPSGAECYALVNPDLGVWYTEADAAGRGRYLVLIHAANYASEVVGCIAPGLARTIYNNRLMVTNSREAMRRIRSVMGNKAATIDIWNAGGAG